MSKNQHRWKESAGDQQVVVLEELARQLKNTWKWDLKDPKAYPLNTAVLLGETKARLRGESPPHGPIKIPPQPKCFSDLLEDKLIKSVYEDQNEGSYADALKQAASGFEEGVSAFRKILHAVQAAYQIDYVSLDLAPKPRVHFLHRNLLEIADLVDIGDLTHEGIVEFLDDLCPCGEKHKLDAIRKLRKRRSARIHRPEVEQDD